MKKIIIISTILLAQTSFAGEDKDETSLSKEQIIRLRCVEIVHAANVHTASSSGNLKFSNAAADQIKEMTVWCEQFILNGSKDSKGKVKP